MSQAPPSAANPVAAVLWQAASGLLFVGMTAVVKYAGDGLPAVQSSFLRFVTGLVFVLPVIPAILRVQYTPRLVGLILARGGLHALAVTLWFLALVSIPLAEVTAMNYLNPVYVMLGAVVFLGEKLSVRRLIAVAVAVLGALVILRPGFREIATGHISMLFMAAFMAGSYLVAKRLSDQLPPAVVVALMSLVVPVFLAPVAALDWQPVSTAHIGWFFVSAAFGTAAHYCMTRAFALAPLGVTQPVAFLQLIWSALLGALMFHEALDPMVVVGAAMILGAVTWSTVAGARARRAAVAGAAP